MGTLSKTSDRLALPLSTTIRWCVFPHSVSWFGVCVPLLFYYIIGILDPGTIGQFQLCSRPASTQCCIIDEYCLDGAAFHVVSSH
jgi:hypothetical protein